MPTSDEQGFLAAIEDRPGDRATRLIYADYLEERGDFRAELIRVEEEMRQLPPYTDRYWALKPRRNALRAQCDPEWLRRMRYGTDYEPTFADVPRGWRQRWRLLREFTERWHGIPLGDVGGRQEEVRQAERKLGRPLPPAVQEWVAYHADLEEQSKFGKLRDRYVVEHLEDLDAVSLMVQAEGDVYWVVRRDSLNVPDPPVDVFVLDWESGTAAEGEYRFVHDSRLAGITTFVFDHLVAHAYGEGGSGISAVQVDRTPELLRQLAEAFPVRSEFGDTHIFEAANILVRLRGRYLDFHVWKPIPRKDVPKFLRSYAPPTAPAEDDIPF